MVSRGFSTLLLAPRPCCWLSFSPLVPSFSLPQPVVRSSTSSAPLSRPLGFPSAVPFAPRWWLLWRWLQILRLGCLLPFLAQFVLPLSSCVFLLFALFSRLLAIRSLLLLLVRALCSSSRSGVSSTFVSLALFERGRSSLSDSLFLFASLLPGGIFECSFAFSLYPVFCCSCGLCWVLFILSTTLCWPCSPDLCFPFSSSWASVPWACSCRVLFLGSVGVPLSC